MKITNLEIIENKKDKFYTVKFDLIDGDEITKNWSTIRADGIRHIFNSVIYIRDPKKKMLSKKTPKTPNPKLYYNSVLTKEVFKLIINLNEFKKLQKVFNLKMSPKYLYDHKKILEREKNLKQLIKIAFKRDEFIGAVCNRGEYYIPLFNMDPGWHLESELPGGEQYKDYLKDIKSKSGNQILKEVNRLLERLDLCSKNTFAVKMESFLDVKVTKQGEEKDFEGVYGWELPEDVIFFDEIFYTETVGRLAKELMEEEEIVEYEVDIIDKYQESGEPNTFHLFDEYYIVDTVIYDDESYFSEKCYDFFSNKHKYLKKIKKDYSKYIIFENENED